MLLLNNVAMATVERKPWNSQPSPLSQTVIMLLLPILLLRLWLQSPRRVRYKINHQGWLLPIGRLLPLEQLLILEQLLYLGRLLPVG